MHPGFHDDAYLRLVIFHCLKQSQFFVETGSAIGNSVVTVANQFPTVRIFSCEPSKAHEEAAKRTKDLSQVTLLKKISPDALYDFMIMAPEMIHQDTVFWLDAHDSINTGKFEWPLRAEIDLITRYFDKGFIFIDDFEVPGRPDFGFDRYQSQKCCLAYIIDYIKCPYRLYYPTYKERTSKHHPLRGWCLIVFGHDDMKFEEKFAVRRA